MGKVAIVIGATGLIGRHLVEQLANTDAIVQVITLTRSAVLYNDPKVINYVVNFDRLSSYAGLFKGDYLFSCLGTTLKQAGSIAAQRRVDLDYQLYAATIAATQGIEHYLLVSSTGADARSGRAYFKMKGELEARVSALPFKRISIFQPSLLIGKRHHFRFGEKMGACLLTVLCQLPWWRHFRPISGQQVAAKMVHVSQQSGKGVAYFRLDQILLE